MNTEICPECGGFKGNVIYRRLPAVNSMGVPYPIADVPPVRVCVCHPDPHPPHKYCPKCEQWRDMDGTRCERCGTALVLRRLNEQPEPAPKPDGTLGDHSVDYRYGDIEIDKITNDLDHPVHVLLSPKEALSLLAWLKQEEAELQRLAKEQNGE